MGKGGASNHSVCAGLGLPVLSSHTHAHTHADTHAARTETEDVAAVCVVVGIELLLLGHQALLHEDPPPEYARQRHAALVHLRVRAHVEALKMQARA